ncbi:MAG: hypothetical protein LC747_06975 [Acidobacteria bacterium]|nr:hypothetical protein [Acidobacteriota bacterium]
MSNDRLPATALKSEADDTARHGVGMVEFGQTGRQAAPRRTVGVYDRPVGRARLSLPMLVILILSALVSVIAAARFIF